MNVRNRLVALLIGALATTAWCTGPSTALAQAGRPIVEVIDSHLASGEFAAARAKIDGLARSEQDAARGRLAVALARSGNRGAAADTLGQIENVERRQQLLPQLAPPLRIAGNAVTDAGTLSGPFTSDGIATEFSDLPAAGGAAGGGVIADFTALMDLIQTTIVPDTWEILGGPSTMKEYPAGIHVDPTGMVTNITVDGSDRLESLRARLTSTPTPDGIGLAEGSSNADWTRPGELRVVSLAALRECLLRQQISGQLPTAAMQNLAGLSHVRYVVLTADDILLAGTVGGIDPASAPWPRDQQTGRTALGLDLLMASASAVHAESSYGCSIDPTAEGLAAAARVAEQISSGQQRIATAADALAAALGPQNISLHQVAGDAQIAWLLVDADRHMKQLALGIHEMPAGVANYLDVVERNVKQRPESGVPNGQLLRLWFAPQPKQVRASTDKTVFELDGLPIRLMSAKEFAGVHGDRHQAATRDPLGEQFAREFTDHFEEIAASYPIYGRLRGAFELTAAMQLVKQQVGVERFEQMVGELALPDLFASHSLSVPRQCNSIAVRHTVRTLGQRHEVYIASGGIHIDPAVTLVTHVPSYPQLDQLSEGVGDRPRQNNRWWWDR